MKKFVFTLFVTVLTLTGCSNCEVPEPEIIGVGILEKSPEREFYVMVDSVKYAVSRIVKDNTDIPPFQGVKVTVFDLGNGNSEIEAFYGEVTPVQAYETLRDNATNRAAFIEVCIMGLLWTLVLLIVSYI